MLIVACHSIFSLLRLFGVSVRTQTQETVSVSIQTEDRKLVSSCVPVTSNASRAPVTTGAVCKVAKVTNDSPREVAASVWCAKDDRDRQMSHIYSEPFEYFV